MDDHDLEALLSVAQANLLAAKADAREAFSALLIPLVERRLRRRRPRASAHDCREAAHEAILSHLAQPDRYDATRSQLDAYLGQRALWRLEDIDRRRRSIAGKEQTVNDADLLRLADARRSTRGEPGSENVVTERLLGAARGSEERRQLQVLLCPALSVEEFDGLAQQSLYRRLVTRIRKRLQRHR